MKQIDLSHLKIRKVRKPKDVQPSLLEFDIRLQWGWVQNNRCPKFGCNKRLYWNRARTIIRCKSRLHSFVLTAKAYEEIVSGKRLNDWKRFNDKLKQ